MSRQIPSLQSIAQNVIVLYKKVKKKKENKRSYFRVLPD